MQLDLTCRNFFDGEKLHGPTRVQVKGGLVISIEAFEGDTDYEYLSPGFVDIQVNGFDQWDVADADHVDLQKLGSALEKMGTTTWLGTIVTAPLERMTACLEGLESSHQGAIPFGFAGVHVEGPFLGSAAGAHNPHWIVPISLQWLEQLPPVVSLITLAAEQSECVDAITQLRSQQVRVSLGHSRPTKHQFQAAVKAGANLVTHLFNGMSGVHHRDDGLALMALTTDGVSVGLIADLVHCSNEAVALAFRAKQANEVVLVSDSIAWNSEWSRRQSVKVINGAPRLPDGTLAGSSTPLGECVRRAVHSCGISPEAALRAATSSPADAAGLYGVGRIQRGESADILALDSSLSVVDVWRRLPSVRA